MSTAGKPSSAGIGRERTMSPHRVGGAPPHNEPPKQRQMELKPPVSTGATVVTREQIAQEAYYLWQKRGGNETVNWLEAEAALKARAGKR